MIHLEGNEILEVDGRKYEIIFSFSKEKGFAVPTFEEAL
jgi:hypothetical protein